MWPANSPQHAPAQPAAWSASTPLWQLVPTRDTAGRPLSDFMMMAPAFKRMSDAEKAHALSAIRAVLARFGERIVFADFNLRLNVLWVSLPATPGLMSLVVAALRAQTPALKLIGQQPLRGDHA